LVLLHRYIKAPFAATSPYLQGINSDRRIYINIDDSMDSLKERRLLLDLNLRLLRRCERGGSCEPCAAVVKSECQGERPRPIAGRRSWREAPMLMFATRGKLVGRSPTFYTAPLPARVFQLPEMSLSSGKLLG
jgi:hypothetical protein